MKKTALLALVLVSGFATAAFAESKSAAPAKRKSLHEEYSGQQYGMAGCGLGSIVFGDKPGIIQVVAATLNGTAGSQTFGITSGTSNCDAGEKAREQAELFIEVNKQALLTDASRGQGETVATLSKIMGCQDAGAFGVGLQGNYSSIFPANSTSRASSEGIVRMIEADGSLLKTCHPATI